MEATERPRMHKYGESKRTRIMIAIVRYVTSGSGLKKLHAALFFLDRVYRHNSCHLLIATVAFAIVNDYVTGTTYIHYTSSGFLA